MKIKKPKPRVAVIELRNEHLRQMNALADIQQDIARCTREQAHDFCADTQDAYKESKAVVNYIDKLLAFDTPEMANVIKDHANRINRCEAVEQILLDVSRGKRELLTREECRELANKLGAPKK